MATLAILLKCTDINEMLDAADNVVRSANRKSTTEHFKMKHIKINTIEMKMICNQ